MDRKKELKQMYKEMKTEMGVFAFQCTLSGKAYIGIDQDLKGTMNGILFQLRAGGYLANKNLSADWKEYGEVNFNVTVLERLDYDKDESKTDYMDDLRVLRDFWKEQFEEVEDIRKDTK